jgi:hypothetical protein
MNALTGLTRQALIHVWLAQLVGTIIICAAVLVLVKTMGVPVAAHDEEWQRWVMMGTLLAVIPAISYLRTFKARLNLDERLERERSAPDPAARLALRKSLSIGGALCELPMAMGVLQLFFGGETRWFLGGTMVTVALRLSYRPFSRMKKP